MDERTTRAAELIGWLDRRAEPSPVSLRARLADAVRVMDDASGTSLTELSAGAGERLLAQLLTDGCGARSAAPDLLAADALVTYAFEAAAEDERSSARSIDASAAHAMARIATLGGGA